MTEDQIIIYQSSNGETTIDVKLQDETVFSHRRKCSYFLTRQSRILPWSNGPVEGNVNKLKTIKRQMYGRASFELLRKRLVLKPT